MQAGKLRHRVTLQSFSDAQNPSTGALTRTWDDEADVWADVRYQKGLEAISSATLVSTVKCSIRIRYRSDVIASWKVLHDGKEFNIVGVMPDPTNRRFLDLACEV